MVRNRSSARCVYTCVVEMSAWPRMVWTVRRSAPFSTMCVAQEWRSMWGDACLPDAVEAAPTICHMRCRVSLRPPLAIKRKGELADVTLRDVDEAALRAARIELGDDYSFLDPTSDAFHYKDKRINLNSSPPANVFVVGLSECLRRVVNGVAM